MLKRCLPLLLSALLGLLAAPAAAAPVTCGEVITSDTRLDRDLFCDDPSKPGVVIGASGVTLDLAGHSISVNSGQPAVLSEGNSRIRILNGDIDAFRTPVVISGGDRNVLRSLDVFTFTTPSRFSDSDHNRVVGNDMEASFDDRSDHNVFARNTVGGLAGLLFAGDRNRAIRNTVGVDDTGIVVVGDRNLLRRNRVNGNTEDGILAGGHGNRLTRNVLSENRDGIVVLDTATATQLLRNRSDRNRDDGIDVESPKTRLIRNSANFNEDLGVEAVADVFAVGNSAVGNGNPLQCLNVSCR
jgi:parallel beta-helix repeat protein